MPQLGTDVVVGNGTPASCTNQAIQDAMDAGGNITFNCGANPITIPISQQLVVGHSDQVLIDGEGQVTLDGGGTSRIMVADNKSRLSVYNLRFINGFSADNMRGAAILANFDSTVEIWNSEFDNNDFVGETQNASESGAVGMHTQSALTIVNSRFLNNNSSNCYGGGGVYALLTDKTEIHNSYFEGNSCSQSARDVGFGGALYVENSVFDMDWEQSSLTICGTTFVDNSGERGGAIDVFHTNNVVIEYSHFENNVAPASGIGLGWGGAVVIVPRPADAAAGTPRGVATIRNSSFVGNQASHRGTILTTGGGDITLDNLTFYDNTAGWGGALGMTGSENTIIASNLTIVGNRATNRFGAISAVSGAEAKFEIYNSIIADNTADLNTPGCESTYTGDRVLQWNNDTEPCINNIINVDPDLGAVTSSQNLTYLPLNPTSPAIDAGANCSPFDQIGGSRGVACDLGAVEAFATPTISDIPNQFVEQDQPTGPIAFTVNDVDTAPGTLTLSVVSGNPGLVPLSNITLGGADNDRTISITPTPGLTGTATITVTVSDGELEAADSFDLLVGVGTFIHLPTILKEPGF